MNVKTDIIPGSCHLEHSFRKTVPRDRLDNVLDQLPAISIFNTPDTLTLLHALVLDLTILSYLWLQISKPTATRQLNKQIAFIILKADAVMQINLRSILQTGMYPILNIPPQFDNMRISFAPSLDQLRQILLGHAHLKRTHCDQRASTALVA